ncbi:hypothetical protein KPH14_010182 [Odynerus spinipes]|uniref:Selenoprotein K n=1 Tax=Odynerus spinipes TaxID=1348599 RepID=A0AAD9RTC2_9HYME|nr:hypothetical protein KPH14_010182 [Odynerus spinipes]
MVYVSSDGKILQSTPWGLKKIIGFFSSIIYMAILFFKTLFGLETDKYGSGRTRDYRPGFGPPGLSNRKLGRPENTKGNVDMPFGGCSSCRG